MMSKQGKAHGLVDNKLLRCSDKPNCVCSENSTDAPHHLPPLLFSGYMDNMLVLKDIIEEMGGIIHAEEAHYLAASFSSTVFGFVDDLEIRLDSAQGLIHFRSSSRVGHSDMGVNKKRVELLKQKYKEKIGVID